MNLEERIEVEQKKVINEYKKQLEILDQPEPGLKDLTAFKEKGYYAIEHLNPQNHVTFGNAKLPKTTMIVNLGTWFNCPGRTQGFCDICQICYDKYVEVMYKERTIGRLEEEIFWRACNAEEFAKALINKINIRNASTKKYKVKQIRFSEVGELRNQKDLEKLIDVSQIVGKETGIKSYVYTHNKNLNFYIEEREYLTINGSNLMIDNEYRVLPEEEIKNIKEPFFKCDCDCTLCNACAHANGILIVEELRK